MQVDEETRVLLSWAMKVLGYGASFIGGVVTATWIVATKVKGYETSQHAFELDWRALKGFRKTARVRPWQELSGI